MADKDNDKERGTNIPEGVEVIQLDETQARLRPAECIARGGRYVDGQCIK